MNQRVILAGIAGKAATELLARYANIWVPTARSRADREDQSLYYDLIDDFVNALRANCHLPPVIYYTEWIDMWSMGDILPGLRSKSPVITGTRYQVCMHSPPLPAVRDEILGSGETQESKWLRARLREAEQAWMPTAACTAIIIAREVLGGLVEDQEVIDSLETIPDWMTPYVA